LSETAKGLIAQPTPPSLGEPAITSNRLNPPGRIHTPRYGFFVNWDENSFSSLREHARDLDVLLPLWLHLRVLGHDFEILSDDLDKETLVRQWLSQNAPSLRIIPVINNFDESQARWRGEELGTLLSSPAGRTALAAQLANYLAQSGLPGLLLDFEGLSVEHQVDFVAFLNLLGDSLHQSGKKIMVFVPAGDNAYDIESLSRFADNVVLGAFDEHTGINAGPLAAQGWFQGEIERVARLVDANKLIVALGSYGADWTVNTRSQEISVPDAWDLAGQSHASVILDPGSLNPSFAYADLENHKEHHVWFLDAATAFNQTLAALTKEPSGLALWRLGTEDEGLWRFFSHGNTPTDAMIPNLASLDPRESIGSRGKGEIMMSMDRSVQPGRRQLEYNKQTGLIDKEVILIPPKRPVISKRGSSPEKQIALTFDDGPSSQFTPAILDILRTEGVKATFFVVGLPAVLHPDILRRAYAEGHDIGNHTFTHPELTVIPKWDLKIELSATQRVIEAELGIQPLLFREPYGSDEETISAGDARSIEDTSEFGYMTIGMHINPKDWTEPPADKIANTVLTQAERHLGHIVLMHDAGGDRNETVAALPKIIQQLKSRGYRFVTVHELLGVSRSAVMPQLPAQLQATALINGIAFWFIRRCADGISVLIMLVIFIAGFRFIFVAIAALLQARAAHERESLKWCPKSFAVLIPAYNEAEVILKTITALLASPLKNFKILVIDDGSTDSTAACVLAAFSKNRRVRLLQKANAGKSAALELGLRRTRAEVVVTLDADTIFRADALERLVRHFADPRIGAVAGAALVGNAVNLITRFQSLEYVISQNLDRRALELANGIQVVPGAIGAWRRSALLQVGGFTSDTLAEDADATIQLERAGWRVLYEPAALAYTEAPETMRTFIRQRFRWMYGMLQAAFKHKDAYRYPGATGVKICTLPNIFIFQFLFTLIAPVMDLLLIVGIICWIWFLASHPGIQTPPAFWQFLGYWCAFQFLEITGAAFAFHIDAMKKWWSLLPLVVVQRFCYRQLLYWVAIRSSAAAIKGKIVGWGKLQRTGKVVFVNPALEREAEIRRQRRSR